MTIAEDIQALVDAEVKELARTGQLKVRQPPARCRICDDVPTRKLVNSLIVRGWSYKDVWMVLDDSINPIRRQQGLKPISQRIIQAHARSHTDLDHPAWGIYRKIVEKRAIEAGKDVSDTIGGLVTGLAFMDTVMQRGYENLVDPDTRVAYTDGMAAAAKIMEFERRDGGAQQYAEQMAQINRVIAAIKDTVPEEYWPVISARMQGHDVSQVRQLPRADDEEEFDPGEDDDFDHDIDTEK